MRSPEIRERFLHFFERRGHHRLPSASLVAHDDPTVLFTVAGMVPLKPFILGTTAPVAPRVCSCQKCFRGSGLRDDVAEVGDTTHHTFFEMLGNWSFGDYFKEGAIDLAWELLTGELDLPADRLWPSVYPDDAVAGDLWRRRGVPKERIVRLAENWWQAGATGPCGYDSEVYFDRGGPCACGRPACTPQDECGGDRWVEIWNLVFMEFDQHGDGTRSLLPSPTVDTGMGLERVAAVLQGVRSNYQTDLFAPLVADFRGRAAAATGSAAGEASLNVLADHLRSSCFLIADGVLPGNEARGYALRRVIRRAAVHGRRIGLRGGLVAAVPVLEAVMGGAYPELTERRALIDQTLRDEESAFARTLAEGSERLDALLADGGSRIRGEDAFRLHDTYGFPVDLTVELARERGAEVDREGFAAAMAAQRERGRRARDRGGFGGGISLPPTSFVGYERLECSASVTRLGLAAELEALAGGETAEVVIEPSPFYAEAGGQVGDTGELLWEAGRALVLDTRTVPGTAARACAVRVEAGTLRGGDAVLARVDAARRAAVMRHHSATHLLHRALRTVLGEGVVQRGSWVGPDHTTFDFNFPRALAAEELTAVEHLVNQAIRSNLAATAQTMPLAAARASGAVMLFDEKYAETVRVVEFDGFSRELCGGTHVTRSGDIGAAMIVEESSIGQGTRRIDMVVGEAAEARWRAERGLLRSAAQRLRVPPEELPARLAALQRQLREAQREAAEARREAARGGGGEAADVEELGLLRFAHRRIAGGREAVKAAVDALAAERLGGGGVALVLGEDSLAVKAGADAIAAGADAGRLVRAASEASGARGGGRADFASGGLGAEGGAEAALAAVRDALRELVAARA